MNNENNTAQELFAQLGVVLDEIVKKKDVALIVEQFVDSFKSLHTKINDKMAENKAILTDKATEIEKAQNALETLLTGKLDTSTAENKDLIKNTISQLTQLVNDAKKQILSKDEIAKITAGDLKSIKDAFKGYEKSLKAISDMQNAVAVRNLLESLRGEELLDASAIRVEVARGVYRNLEEVLREILDRVKTLASRGNGGGGGVVGGINPKHQVFAVSSATTFVTLSQGVAAQGNAIFLRYQGQMLKHGVDYSVSGNKVTFISYSFEDDTEVSVTYW